MSDAPECFRSGDARWVKGRHVTDCRSRDCDGCIECTKRHCVVCTRTHLEPTERQACPGCVGRVRRDLIAIVDLVALLGDELDGYPTASPGADLAGRSMEHQLPGRDALVMLAAGSNGIESMREWIAGDKAALDHELAGDPPSVLHELTFIEDEWRRVLGHGPGGPRDLSAVHRYLDEHLPGAIQEPRLFPDDAEAVRRLRARLEAARRDSNRPMRGVTCFDCDTTLTRALRAADRCGHTEPTYMPLPDVRLVGPHGYPHVTTAGERKAAWEAHEAAHTAYLIDHMACDQGGFADQWECATCGVTYDQARYWRAVRQAHEDLQHEQSQQAGTRGDAS